MHTAGSLVWQQIPSQGPHFADDIVDIYNFIFSMNFDISWLILFNFNESKL